jgi:ABC-type dipeptide/oligopeptide/nickel transport system permease subunit
MSSEPRNRMGSSSMLTRLFAAPKVRVGALLLCVLLALAFLVPALSSAARDTSDFEFGVLDALPAPPSSHHLLGTDRLFRDVLVRIAFAVRTSLGIAIVATLLAAVVGTLVGVVSGMAEGSTPVQLPWTAAALAACGIFGVGRLPLGVCAAATIAAAVQTVYASYIYHRDKRTALEADPFGKTPGRSGQRAAMPALGFGLDSGLMWLVDVGMSFPFLLIVMAIASTTERTTAMSLTFTLAMTGWLGTARIVRARTLQLRSAEFLSAARALGASSTRVIFVHVLPNVLAPVIATSALSAAQMIVAEAVLSYLGAGLSPPAPTLGRMIYEGQEVYLACPWLLLAPAAAVLVAVYAFNLIGEGLRNALGER